jgi:mannose-6-phosphate isomerase-like protein (cupin superfamily)
VTQPTTLVASEMVVLSDRAGDRGPAVIENPLSGERIVIRQTGAVTAGTVLAWELFLAPGGGVPSAHCHPAQEERFRILEGRMRFLLAGRKVTVGPGETVIVPQGAVHHFANAGPGAARVAVETRPALDMETMFVVAAALAQDQHASRRPVPRLVDLALFMDEFKAEVRSPYLAPLVGLVTTSVARLARCCRVDIRYRHLRDTAARHAR